MKKLNILAGAFLVTTFITAAFVGHAVYKNMDTIEVSFLNHPALIRYNLPDSSVAIFVTVAISCLFLCFKCDFKDKEKKYTPVPSWAGKCWRSSWLFGAVALVTEAYGHWSYPGRHKSDSFVEVMCLSLWSVLFVVGNFGILKEAFRHRHEMTQEVAGNESYP